MTLIINSLVFPSTLINWILSLENSPACDIQWIEQRQTQAPTLPCRSYAAPSRPLTTPGFNFISLLKCIWVKSSYLKSLPTTSPYELSRDWANKGVSQRVINWNNNNRFKSKNCAIYCATKAQLYIRHWRRNLSLPQCPIFHLEIKIKALLVRQSLNRRQHMVVRTHHQPRRPASLAPGGTVSDITEHGAVRNKEWRRISGG